MKKLNSIGVCVWLGLPFALACEEPPVVAGGRQTCATRDGRVRCWGAGEFGVLGYGNTNDIGDNEDPSAAGDVPVWDDVQTLAAGYYHTCALLESGGVQCWGRNNYGQLGQGNTTNIGDNESISAAVPIALGGTATQIAAGYYHTCALLTTGAVRCWGNGTFGQLGYGNTNHIGDNELPYTAGSVSLGGTATFIAAGGFHTCAVLSTGAVRCWGANAAGQLGLAHTAQIGDNETPATSPSIAVGGLVDELALGEQHTCALLGDQVKCWGYGAYGQLGYANTTTIGDNEHPSTVGYVNVGDDVTKVTAGGNQTCALTSPGNIRCWGEGLWGPLGYGSQVNIGDNETPASRGDVSVGGTAVSVSAGYDHTCAVLSKSGGWGVRCWGHNVRGVLGRGTAGDVGDDELPSSIPFIVVE